MNSGQDRLYVKRILKLKKTLELMSVRQGFDLLVNIQKVPAYSDTKPVCFGRFVAYYGLVSRWKALYVDSPNNFFCGVSLPWVSGTEQCFENFLIILRPEIHIFSVDLFASFVKELQREMEMGIVIKHIPFVEAKLFIPKGFRFYHRKESWSSEAVLDDQTFEEVVLDTTSSNVPSKKFARGIIRELVEKGNYKLVKLRHPGISPEEGRFELKQELISLFYRWIEALQKRKPELLDKSFLTWHFRAFDHLVYDNEITFFFLEDISLGEKVGVFALAETSNIQADVVFSFSFEERGNFQKFAFDYLVRETKEMYKWLNLGGSESESLFKFKSAIGPCKLIPSTHLIFNPEV